MWKAHDEMISVASDRLRVRWLVPEDALLVSLAVDKPDGTQYVRNARLPGRDIREDPRVIRLLAQVIKVWEALADGDSEAEQMAFRIVKPARQTGSAQVVWYPHSLRVGVYYTVTQPELPPYQRRVFLSYADMAENPAVLRVLAQVVRVWEGIIDRETLSADGDEPADQAKPIREKDVSQNGIRN